MRLLATIVALLTATSVGLAAPPTHAAAPDPKVVVIVGPVGDVTERYRAQGREAAEIARRFTSNVVEVFSPNATWPAVREALQGASIIVYLGHGNGWPSRYRDSLYPATQNGFGLNPVPGVDDATHQYFGETHVARDVELAPNAVVVLSHLCYASGNTEPGLPEGTLDEARQRVDNYAAGFIAAGAAAVLADAYVAPGWYVRQLLDGARAVDRIWRGAPSARSHWHVFHSERSDGFTIRLNPARAEGDFYRSLVVRDGLTAAMVRSSAPGTPSGPVPPPPSLAATDLAVAPPAVAEPPTAGTTSSLTIPYTVAPGATLPDELTVGVRWDPIEVSAAGEEPLDLTSPAPRPVDLEADRPDEPPTTGPEREPPPPDPRALVQPERLGAVVTPVPATVDSGAITAEVSFPVQPGLYRLVTTLHDGDGVAYDAATQALVPALLVRVTGQLAAAYVVPSAIRIEAGTAFALAAGVANLGTHPWGTPAALPLSRATRAEPRVAPALVARWVALEGGAATLPAPVAAPLPAGLAAGSRHEATLALRAPAAGEYLLVVDVVVPEVGSLAARGVDPALVRVTVRAADRPRRDPDRRRRSAPDSRFQRR